MTSLFTPAEVRTAVELLASRPLIRLVTEIDDNGAIPPRRLATALPDFPRHQQRRAPKPPAPTVSSGPHPVPDSNSPSPGRSWLICTTRQLAGPATTPTRHRSASSAAASDTSSTC